ncbi:ABC transporter substrate-binding protein [Paenibacillus yanchengensis]|uniref:ABC transporter substrate-binding protein n=1 Tax=Paenibacillus yanchengensis TaxID=2035833 RepID=A0ABW4YG64_9BACL
MMKKRLFIVMSLILTVVLVAGCGSKNESDSSNGEKKGKKLTYMASQGWVTNAEMELAKQFEQETGIKIDFQIVPSDQYMNIIKARLNSGEGPDIFGGQSGVSELALNYNVEKNAVDLSDMEWVNRIDPLSLEQLTINDKVYGLTIWDTYNSFVIGYNKKIFADLQLEIPKTYEEFKNLSIKIKEAGIEPIYEPIADGWHHVMWFTEAGPQYDKLEPGLYEDLNQNKRKFVDSEVMVKALEQMKEMYDLGLFGENSFSDMGSETPAKLGSKQYAMSLTAQSAIIDIVNEFDEYTMDDFGFFVLPIADNQVYYINPGGPSKFIYSDSKHVEEAKAYFEFITREENLQYLLDNDKIVANLNFPGLKDKYSSEQKKLFEAYPERGVDMQNYITYFNPQWMDIAKDMVAMLSGVMEPKEVLENIDTRREEMAVIAKDPHWTNE